MSQTKTKRTRWVCPVCDDGKLGLTRPRKDNIIRYCLPCSEESGKLVERVTPSLDKKRGTQADKAKAKRDAKAKREAKRQKKKTHLTLWDEGGRIVELDVEKTVRDFAEKACVGRYFKLTWNRRSDNQNTGRANENHVHLSIGSRSLEAFCKVAAHELGHCKAGGYAGHSNKWRDAYEDICAKLWDTKPIYRGSVEHHRYAIDPEILSQLQATSRGEYKRSKAKLPLAGKQIGTWERYEIDCDCCNGDKVIAAEPCSWCKETGRLEATSGIRWGYKGNPHGEHYDEPERECNHCDGTGEMPSRDCGFCKKTGKIWRKREVEDAI